MNDIPRKLPILSVLCALICSPVMAGGFPERAVISGVPQYHQQDIDIPNPCVDENPDDDVEVGFPSGCGPTAGAMVLGWWERRGVAGLIRGSVEPNGLPQSTIFDLGTGPYMDRIAFCSGTAVAPPAFKHGLQKWFDDFSPVPFEVLKYEVMDDAAGNPIFVGDASGDMDELWDIVRDEINEGRPMVALLRIGRRKLVDRVHYKWADHYPLVVGYDGSGGKRTLIVSAGWEGLNSYLNVHIDRGGGLSSETLELGERTANHAAIKYNFYAIRPVDPVPLAGGSCQGLLVNGTRWHDGVSSGLGGAAFAPDDALLVGHAWPETEEIHAQDGSCFVATWSDEDADGVYATQDNCPDEPNPDQEDTDTDNLGDVCDHPDYAPGLVSVDARVYGADTYLVTVTANALNSGTDPGPELVEALWEGPGAYTPLGPCTTSAMGVTLCTHDPRWQQFPNQWSESVSTATLPATISHSWLVDAAAWRAATTRCDELTMTLTLDPSGSIEELAEDDNRLSVVVSRCFELFGGFDEGPDVLRFGEEVAARLRPLEVTVLHDQWSFYVRDRDVGRVLERAARWGDIGLVVAEGADEASLVVFERLDVRR